MNYWQCTTWVQCNSAFNNFESLGDSILTFIHQAMIIYEAHMCLLMVSNEHEAALLAHLTNFLLHLLELVWVWLLISNEDDQDVCLFGVKMIHIEKAGKTAYEGYDPTQWRAELKLLECDSLLK